MVAPKLHRISLVSRVNQHVLFAVVMLRLVRLVKTREVLAAAVLLKFLSALSLAHVVVDARQFHLVRDVLSLLSEFRLEGQKRGRSERFVSEHRLSDLLLKLRLGIFA